MSESRCQTWGAYSGRRCTLPQGHVGRHHLEPVIGEPPDVAAAPDPVASPLALKIEANGSISRISGGPLEQPVHTKGTVGPFWDEIEAWRDGYRAGLSARQSDDLTEGDGA